MKFCYLDESGTGTEPYAVMVGIIVDSHRMHVTKEHWENLLAMLRKITKQKSIKELHTRNFYKGTGIWKNINGPVRSNIIDAIIQWLNDRKHDIVFTAIDKNKFRKEFSKESASNDIKSIWQLMALHITLAIQKHHQKQEKTKGNTILVFDNEEIEKNKYTDLILNPPKWTDTYYAYKKGERLSKVVDVPHFVDSKHVGLIQVADFISYLLRLNIEIQENFRKESYSGEKEKLENWVQLALNRSIPKSSIFMKSSRCSCADLFYRYAPSCILN